MKHIKWDAFFLCTYMYKAPISEKFIALKPIVWHKFCKCFLWIRVAVWAVEKIYLFKNALSPYSMTMTGCIV